MHTKPFFPFYQGNKANTAPTEALYLPYSTPAATTTGPAPNSGVQSNTFPKAFKSGFVSAFAILGTMNLQPHGGFAEVINTFRESSISSLDLLDKQFCPLQWLYFVPGGFFVCLLVVNGFFSLSFCPLKLCVKLHLAKGNLERAGRWDAVPELGHMCHSTPQHPKDVAERWLPPEQPRYAKADANSQ